MIPRSYLLVPMLLMLACSNRNNPRAVSEDFIYNYYQHANQEASLKLSHGLAAEKLEDEIARVREVRGPGEQVEEMPKMEYELIGKEEGSTHVLFNYKLTIKSRGGTTTHTRNIVINTEQIDGQWKVVNFDEY
ncbi:MAG: hypothetical protein OXN25_19830 [Candidatus Poribacteria bacterium]|nr:hypothetical protein [Candidatus Poribacteria bacterium]MYK18327.1 hypothetical protein [Candidatus Poribacteria bacterium]